MLLLLLMLLLRLTFTEKFPNWRVLPVDLSISKWRICCGQLDAILIHSGNKWNKKGEKRTFISKNFNESHEKTNWHKQQLNRLYREYTYGNNDGWMMNKENNKIKNPVKLTHCTLYTAHTLFSISLALSFSFLPFRIFIWISTLPFAEFFFSAYEIHKTLQYNNKMYVCIMREVYTILDCHSFSVNGTTDSIHFIPLRFLFSLFSQFRVCVLSRANEKHAHTQQSTISYGCCCLNRTTCIAHESHTLVVYSCHRHSYMCLCVMALYVFCAI